MTLKVNSGGEGAVAVRAPWYQYIFLGRQGMLSRAASKLEGTGLTLERKGLWECYP